MASLKDILEKVRKEREEARKRKYANELKKLVDIKLSKQTESKKTEGA